MNGPLRRGWTPLIGPQSPALAWRISAETNYGGPVVGRGGTIYQGTFDGKLLALRPDGTIKWTVSAGTVIESTPAILQDRRIAFVDDGGTLYVVNPDGSPSWRYQTGTGTFAEASPAIGRDGTIYTGIGETVYAFHPDGSIRWTYPVGHFISGPVSVAPNGVVLFTAPTLYALDPTGVLLWQTSVTGLGGAPSIGPQGVIYVNSTNTPIVYAFNPNGTTKWSYQVDTCCSADFPSTPAIGPDGTIYVGMGPTSMTMGGVVLALNPDGSLKWEAHYGDYGYGIALGGDGTVYFSATTLAGGPAGVWALNPDGTLKWAYDDSDGYVRTPPAIGKGQRLYAGGVSGFFAIGP